MSEGDVSLIRDEDLLRRMWQQTEDFSRKKQIRAHMYRLREERLRSLYSPEPARAHGKGVEAAQTHVSSLLDQSFQGLKSKEVRDAGSPPKEFHYRGQDLKDLSNAGWNVESENRTTDDGHTHVKSVHANIEGRYDVEGGAGKFAAVDHQKRAVTEYQDDSTSLKRAESSSQAAAHEQLVRNTDNGTEFSSTTSKSSATQFQQVSSTKHEVPYAKEDHNLTRGTDTEERRQVANTKEFEQSLKRNDFESGELVSKKVDYPDDNTKVIVETRCLPDGTRVTSTRREFRAPAQSTHSEQRSQTRSESKYSSTSQQRSDIKSSKTAHEFDSRTDNIVDSQRHADDYDFKRNQTDYLHQKDDASHIQRTNNDTRRFDTKESSSKITTETIDKRNDVVDSQRHVDDYDITRNETDYTTKRDDCSTTERRINQHYETKMNESDRRDISTIKDVKSSQNTDYSNTKDTQRVNRAETKVDEIDRREVITHKDDQNIKHDFKDSQYVKDNEERLHNKTRDKKVEEIFEKKTLNDQYQTTYQTDFTQKKISNDWSPTHQAWASTLRADTPSSTRPTTRASSPGSRTHMSSTSSLRSSVSPDKTPRKPPSRGGSPSKGDRFSPSRTTSDRYSSTHSTHSVTETNRHTSPIRRPPMSPTRHGSSPDRKPQDNRPRASLSPEKRAPGFRPSTSPDRKPGYKSSPTEDHPITPSAPYATSPYRSNISPEKSVPKDDLKRTSQSPERKPGYQRPRGPSPTSDYARTTSPSRPYATSPERKPAGYQQPTLAKGIPEKEPVDKYPKEHSPIRPSVSPDRKPGYMRPTASKPTPDTLTSTRYTSPDRKSPAKHEPAQSPERKPHATNIKDNYKFIDEETKMHTRFDREDITSTKRTSQAPDRYASPHEKSPSPTRQAPEDTVDFCRPESPIRPSLRKGNRSPSPPKGPVTFTQDQVDKTESTVSDVKEKYSHYTEDIAKKYRTPKQDYSPTKDRETSPSQHGGYNKKEHTNKVEEVTMVTTKNTDDVKYDSLTRREKISQKVPRSSVSPAKKPSRDSVSPTKRTDVPREPSPTKYGTYDKKRRSEETEETSTDVITTTKDVRYDSLTRREKMSKEDPQSPASPVNKMPREGSPTKPVDAPRESSPANYGTYDKKRRTEEREEITSVATKTSEDVKYDSLIQHEKMTPHKVPDLSPTKKSPRDSVSPVKSPAKDAKYKHSSDFITTERRTEEVNKKTKPSDRPRQLVTPSTSPTRKPKTDDTAPSTGQSSPTTSVSEFVYFSSPTANRTIVTDLDDVEFYTETNITEDVTTTYKRPETLDVERSPSPSKIPCRSPSPEKRPSPTKDRLPRKSSLKKPKDITPVSPVEKPPSSFRVSPTDEITSFPEHKIVKKDNPDKPFDSPAKPKPPLERRETYEERCLKILGVVDDKSSKTVTKLKMSQSSPSVSPCRSPEPKQPSTFTVVGEKTTKSNVTDFITREQEDTIKKTTRRDHIITDKKPKTPSRESSPTKLQDIISQNTSRKRDEINEKETVYEKTKDTRPNRPSSSPENTTIKQSPEKTLKEDSPKLSVSTDRKPGYMRPTVATITKFESTTTTEDIEEDTTESVRLSADRETGYQEPKDSHPRPTFESPKNQTVTRANSNPENKLVTAKPANAGPEKQPIDKTPKRSSVSPDRKPSYMRPTTTRSSCESTVTSENILEDIKSTTFRESLDKETGHPKATYPSRPKYSSPTRSVTTPERAPGYQEPSSPTKPGVDKEHPEKTSTRASVSPDRKPGYMKPTTATTTRYEETSATEDIYENTSTKSMKTKLPSSVAPDKQPDSTRIKPEDHKFSHIPSLTKKTRVAEDITEFIQSEREQEILDRVQKSLRKLSPTRDQRSPSREKSPDKTTLSLQDIDVIVETVTTDITENDEKLTEQQNTTKSGVTRTGMAKDDKPKEQKPTSKPPSRTVSPTKKPIAPTSSKVDKSSEYPKSRSISPKKPVSPTERPQSPQVPKASGIKPREPVPSQFRKPTPGNTSPTKTEKITTDLKKTTGVTKQNSFTKTSTTTKATKVTSPTNKTEPELKRTPAPKGINKENVSPRKDDTKVARTVSETSIKTKKTSPQRMKSKPEIQIHDLSTTKTTTKQTSTSITQTQKYQTKLAPKPKSATALNTSTDDDDIIIDVEQAKSSRENSPDRICPTPVGFLDDVGTPRFPDEVSEPDDDFRRRTHHTIHEAESIVDDIVEICEDDELFVKRTDVDHLTASDECLLSVTDKVSKFSNKIDAVTKPKDAVTQFKDTERMVHSDFIDENLKSDECLLSVSEKVNKFAKGPRDTKDSRSPSRKIVDEYDTQTIYQDDYTKLSVNDKAHMFVETAENVTAPKTKAAQKKARPDLSNVDESLKSDDCLLSVSDKVNKFVKTAEQFLTETHEVEDKEKKVKEQYEKIIKHIVQDDDEDYDTSRDALEEDIKITENKTPENKTPSFAQETTSTHAKAKDYPSPNLKPTERVPVVKITTLRSSEAVKKAKALFENIAITQKSTDTKTAKLTDIGVIKKSPKTDSTTVLHPSLEDGSPNITDVDSEVDAPLTPTTKDRPSSGTLSRPVQRGSHDDKPRSSPARPSTQSPEVPRTKPPTRHTVEITSTTKTVLSRYPAAQDSPKHLRPESGKREKSQEKFPKQPQEHEPKQSRKETEHERSQEKVPSYQRPTKTSQIKEEKTEETETSTRRGSGKFGVELRRTSVERATISSERRRSSTEHHQPCIEDIFDLDLLEQMLEKVVGYEQRRRIRAQIRIAKKRMESEHTDTVHTKTVRHTIMKTKSPERRPLTKSPERQHKTTPHKTLSPERSKVSPQTNIPSGHVQPQQKEESKPILNGHAKVPNYVTDKRQRHQSPQKHRAAPSPVRQPSPDKKTRTASPSKTPSKPKGNRFNEYASAYMKKVGLNEADKVKFSDVKSKKTDVDDHKTQMSKARKSMETEDYSSVNEFDEKIETKTTSMSKSFSERRTSSKDTIEIIQVNGKRSLSPEKKRSPERRTQSPTERLYHRSPSPDFKRPKSDSKETIIKTEYESHPKGVKKETVVRTVVEEHPEIKTTKKETIIKTVYDIEKKIPKESKLPEEKPSWVTNRNLKKITSETRTFSNKRIDNEKPKYRAPSPSKVISKPIDVITSSYGPGPLDADGRPLFGIKALRNGATNYQVKGTVIREEYHSRNGGAPQGSVSVTAYSTEPEELARLLQAQGERPSRLHGLAAITTTRQFGGDTGNTYKETHTKEERASLDQFTHSDRRIDSRSDLTDTRSGTRVADTKASGTKVADTRDRRDARTAKVEGREERRERVERREDKKTVRQSSVKSLTEKYIKSASECGRSERPAYPKAGLILRAATATTTASTAPARDTAGDSSPLPGIGRTDSIQSLSSEDGLVASTRTERSPDGTVTTTTTSRQERSFLDSSTKVTGVQDILTRMKNADIVVHAGDSSEDAEARALLNKFLGATVLMAGMQGYVTESQQGKLSVKEAVRSSGGETASRVQADFDPELCWDERVLRQHLEASRDYEQRRRVRARIRALMAEQEACASAVTDALAAAGEQREPAEAAGGVGAGDARAEEEVTVTSSVRRNSSEKTVSSSTTTKTSKVIESVTRPAAKPVSPFAKFRQLEKQNPTNSPNSPKTPQSPGSPAQPYFKFTDPALQASALTIKERLLQWCRDKTRDYENVKLENFSTSWADGLAFCALVHHFLPDAFDYSKLTADKRRHNFTLAFKIADEKAGIYPLLDVDDMVAMRKPDWKCVFTYVQSIHRRFKDQQ